MYIKTIELANIRNYSNQHIELVPGINIFCGENGSGKTNVIEAIYWIAMTRSFRTTEDRVIVQNNKDGGRVVIEASDNDLDKTFSLDYNSSSKRKSIKINDNKLKRMSLIVGEVPVVLFSPENIMMIKGEPSLRRRFVDDLISQTDNDYYQTLLRYSKEVSHRNYLLKGIREGSVNKFALKVWNEQIREKGTKILLKRVGAIKELNEILSGKLSKENIKVKLTYSSKIFVEMSEEKIIEKYDQHFEQRYDEEVARATTLIGPHRDDIDITFNDLAAKQYASEGQQRLTTILIKLSEGLFIRERKGKYPIVMLDDFSSELDYPNSGFIGETFGLFKQIIITTTYKENLRGFEAAREFEVNNGKVMIKE